MSGVRWIVVSFSGSCLLWMGCAKLVGITETEVTREETLDARGTLGGAAGSSAVATAGTGGAAGLGGNGGNSGGGAGSGGGGGSPALVDPDAGPSSDAAPAGCTQGDARCGATGREVCNGGVWQAEACALSAPRCEGDGQCVVRGPALVAVGNFFIDATEVTVAQYGEFLAAKNGDTSGQIAACSWNASYWEGPAAMEQAQAPIASVDWCDAAAFCSWAGKRLCGRIGGGSITAAEKEDENLNQWVLACGGPNGFPEPNDMMECNLSDGFRNIAPVATYPGCEGYYPDVFDMLGNVWEWVDDCETSIGPDDVCAPMGGSTIDGTDAYCTYYGNVLTGTEPWRRSTKILYNGFRCCSG
jgi:formylglycine-generating enzyme